LKTWEINPTTLGTITFGGPNMKKTVLGFLLSSFSVFISAECFAQRQLNEPDPRLETVISRFSKALAEKKTSTQPIIYCVSPQNNRLLTAISMRKLASGGFEPTEMLAAMDSNNFGKFGPKTLRADGTSKLYFEKSFYGLEYLIILSSDERFGLRISYKAPYTFNIFMVMSNEEIAHGANGPCFNNAVDMYSYARKFADPSNNKSGWD
jgi:hypothetical protein